MTDVVRKIITANSVSNNTVVTRVTNVGTQNSMSTGINRDTAISGVNGVTTNGVLDTRFDDKTYYSS